MGIMKNQTKINRQKMSMKVRYKGKTEFLVLTNNQIYDVISIEKGWYRIIDDSDDDYLYPPELFDIIEE